MPSASPRRRAPAFLTSCVFGAVGAALLLVGLLSGSEPLVLLATLFGGSSLVAALVWRGQLISRWHADRYERSQSSDGLPVRSPPAPRR